MTKFRNATAWAAAFICVALANRFGLIADANATTMFAVLPGLWVATGGLGSCTLRKSAA